MITRIPYFLLVATLICQQATAFTVTSNDALSSSPSLSSKTSLSASSTSLSYAVADVESPEKLNSFRESILKSYQREEPQSSIAQLLTEQVAREFTTGRRYLLAAAAVKELSDNFYDVEEQQRVRAMELMEYARSHGIQLLDYASQVDRSPIDKSMETADLLQELLVQEQRDVQLLDQVMAQVSSKNTELLSFLETIRADQLDRQDQILHTLADALPTLQNVAADAATSIATAHVSSGDISLKMGEDLLHKMQDVNQLRTSLSRWTENQLQVMGHHLQDAIAKGSHFTFTGATAATVAAVDAVDPESLPSSDEILDALPVEDILQVVDSAASLLEEPSQLVDSIQQSLMETEALSQIVDVVTGLY